LIFARARQSQEKKIYEAGHATAEEIDQREGSAQAWCAAALRMEKDRKALHNRMLDAAAA
jgi:hypothetical protein